MRRRVFHGAVLGLLGGSLLRFTPASRANGLRRDCVARLFFYLPGRSAVLALGRRCAVAGFQPAAELAFDRKVSQAIAADFAAGRVAIVDGWLISESEARIAAALATQG